MLVKKKLSSEKLFHPMNQLLRNQTAANGLIGAFYARSFDLEEMYPHSRAADQYYLQGIDFGERPRG